MEQDNAREGHMMSANGGDLERLRGELITSRAKRRMSADKLKYATTKAIESTPAAGTSTFGFSVAPPPPRPDSPHPSPLPLPSPSPARRSSSCIDDMGNLISEDASPGPSDSAVRRGGEAKIAQSKKAVEVSRAKRTECLTRFKATVDRLAPSLDDLDDDSDEIDELKSGETA